MYKFDDAPIGKPDLVKGLSASELDGPNMRCHKEGGGMDKHNLYYFFDGMDLGHF